MTASRTSVHDVIVVGGRVAGAATARLLAARATTSSSWNAAT